MKHDCIKHLLRRHSMHRSCRVEAVHDVKHVPVTFIMFKSEWSFSSTELTGDPLAAESFVGLSGTCPFNIVLLRCSVTMYVSMLLTRTVAGS